MPCSRSTCASTSDTSAHSSRVQVTLALDHYATNVRAPVHNRYFTLWQLSAVHVPVQPWPFLVKSYCRRFRLILVRSIHASYVAGTEMHAGSEPRV